MYHFGVSERAVKSSFAPGHEFDHAFSQGKQRIVFAALHSGSGKKLAATLADKHLAACDSLAVKLLYSQVLWLGIAPVFCRSG